MGKIFKWLLYLILLVILVIGGYFGYLYFSKMNNRDAFTVIPDDAVYMIETSNLSEGWNAISNSKIWSNMKKNAYFKDINESASMLDSLIKGNQLMNKILEGRQLIVSAHMTSGVDYDFLFVVDIQKAAKISFLSDIMKIFTDYSVTERKYKNCTIIEMLDNETKGTLSLVIIDNLLVGSFSGSLVEKAIDQKDLNFWTNEKKFQLVKSEINRSNLFNYYFNYAQLSRYMKSYLAEESEMTRALSQVLDFSTFNINIENERLIFDGYTNVNDSIPSYFKALLEIDPGKIRGYEFFPDQTALYLAVGFDSFDDFYAKLTEQYAKEDTTGMQDINKNMEKLQSFLNVDLKQDFFSWIGTELAFAKMMPASNAREADVVIAINAKNIEDAKTGLTHLMRQVKRRTPIKFEEVVYKNFPINYLDIKGFFKMFFGKLFGTLEKPYFTYIEDYVVFSNSPSALMDFIDAYTTGKTLQKNEAFIAFRDEFSNKTNISVFIQTPKLYAHLYNYGKEETRQGLKNNKELILSFTRIGFQMVSDGSKFNTTLKVDHDENALFDETLENIERSAEDLFIWDIDSLRFKNDIPTEPDMESGLFKNYYPDSSENRKILKVEGMISDGLTNGLWKTYFESGNLKSVILFKDGKAEGLASFFYDNEANAKKMDANFKEDVMEGTYTEYYENGSKKAVISFEEGKMSGNAVYYYDSGVLKIEGYYKEGEKAGKWKYYSETGEIFNKEKWKKGDLK